MAKKKAPKSGLISTNQTVAHNKRAAFDYALEDKFEAGLALTGTEVKSLRHGQASINEAYIGPKDGEMILFNAHIPVYQQAGKHLQHSPKRERKLLLHKREIGKLMGAVQRQGYSILPVRLFFNDKGLAKLEIALGKGKKAHDKRESIKDRDWKRDQSRLMREK